MRKSKLGGPQIRLSPRCPMVRTLEVGVEGRMGPEMLTKVASRTNEDLCKTTSCEVGGMAAKVDVWTFGWASGWVDLQSAISRPPRVRWTPKLSDRCSETEEHLPNLHAVRFGPIDEVTNLHAVKILIGAARLRNTVPTILRSIAPMAAEKRSVKGRPKMNFWPSCRAHAPNHTAWS